jgi:deazaflavin-dependent oxidoreductase (nitroreductase family)
MSKEPVRMTEIERAMRDWIDNHARTYLESGGAEGHCMDLSQTGGLPFTTCLLLKTVGRKSGEVRYSPLIYGDTGGEVVIIASRGGADIHPAWYFNITESKTVDFQIATQAFRATWRHAEGKEREDIWKFMEGLYPPFKDYKKATERRIPVVVMQPKESIARFTK